MARASAVGGPLGAHAAGPRSTGMSIPLWSGDFLRKQVLTSRNVQGRTRLTDAVVHVAMGGLNQQIEHHLLPSMPTANLRRARVLVRDHCAGLGVAYHETTLVRSWAEALRHLDAVGVRR